MPVPRGKKPKVTALSKIPKLTAKTSENKVKRNARFSSSMLSMVRLQTIQPLLRLKLPSCNVSAFSLLPVLQDEGPQVKRSSSPPNGAPKKRTAFIDITNVSPALWVCGFGNSIEAQGP